MFVAYGVFNSPVFILIQRLNIDSEEKLILLIDAVEICTEAPFSYFPMHHFAPEAKKMISARMG